jgi:hypothetical protein
MNFFSVLDDSDNDEPKVAKKAPTSTAGGATATTAKKAPAAAASAPKKEEKAKAGNAKPAKAEAPEVIGDDKGKENARGGAGHRQGKSGDKRHDSRYAKEGEGAKREGKREKDRRSSDPSKPRGQKKDGKGKFGAGNVEEEAREGEKNPIDAVDEEVDATEEVEPEPESTEPEVPKLSLADFMAQRNAQRANAELFGSKTVSRKVNESEFSGLTKVVDDLQEDAFNGKKKKAGQARVASDAKPVVELSFKVQDEVQETPREEKRRDRGGNSRSGGRSGGNAKGKSGSNGAVRGVGRALNGIDLNDASAFPAVGTKA